MNSRVSPFRVFVVDDEPFYVRELLDDLRQCFVVEYYSRAIDAISSIRTVSERVGLIVDVMMPPPNTESAVDTEEGQTTGLWLVSQLADQLRRYKSFAIVFTHKDVSDCQRRIVELNLEDVCVEVLRKSTKRARVADRVRRFACEM